MHRKSFFIFEKPFFLIFFDVHIFNTCKSYDDAGDGIRNKNFSNAMATLIRRMNKFTYVKEDLLFEYLSFKIYRG